MEDELDEEKDLITDSEIIEKISKKIFSVIKTKEETNILSELYKKEYKNVDLTLCVNSSQNNNTILTTLANYDLTKTTLNFLSWLTHSKKTSKDLLNYINQKNSRGYNALLYSAFRGNLDIFNKLMEIGADISLTNSSGLNVLHLASQGNYPNIIVFLIEKYFVDINSRDNKGNTALHWAVYKNSKQAVDYLIYYNIDINLKDNDGETALGIAMSKGNSYLIKRFNDDFNFLVNKNLEEKMEIKEVDEEIELDNSNNQDIQLNDEGNKKFKNIFFNEFIKKFLGTKPNNMTVLIFLLIIFIIEGINQIIILKGYNNFFMSFVFFIFFLLLLFFYYVTSKSDAGEVANKCINSLILLAGQGEDLKNICPWCINFIDENTHHCFLCNKCFKFQEFHDVYLNNCIGRNNFDLYMNFLYYLELVFSFKLIISIWGLFWISGERYKNIIGLIVFQIILLSTSLIFCSLKIRAKLRKNKNVFDFSITGKGIKNNSSDLSRISTINTQNNMNIQLTSLESIDRDI